MAYSRWLNSYWYCYFSTEDTFVEATSNIAFTYEELKNDIDACISRVKDRIKERTEDYSRLPTEKYYEELKGYMMQFIEDIENNTIQGVSFEN